MAPSSEYFVGLAPQSRSSVMIGNSRNIVAVDRSIKGPGLKNPTVRAGCLVNSIRTNTKLELSGHKMDLVNTCMITLELGSFG